MQKLKDPHKPDTKAKDYTLRTTANRKKDRPSEQVTGHIGHAEYIKEEEYIGRLAAIVEFSEDAIISKSMDGTIKSWNKSSERIFGYTPAEAIGKNISLIVPEEYIEEEKMIMERIRNNEIVEHFETVRKKNTGEGVFVSITVSPLKDLDDNIVGVSKIVRDISLRKKAEAQLVITNKELVFQNEEKEKRAAELVIANKELAFQNEEKAKRAAELQHANRELAFQNKNRSKEIADYKYALDQSSILAITDHKGVIQHVNANFCAISKYKFDELVGQDHRIINSGYHSKEFIRDLWVTISSGQIWRGEIRNKAKDGTIYWVDTTIVPFLDAQGKPYQYAALRADITLRKEAEEEVKTLYLELEDRVKERTEDLESFSYSVSHDLRAPLRAMNGYAKMLIAKYGVQFDQEANRLVNNIVNNAAKMGQLIDDLLTFSRLGRREMTKMNIPMQDMVAQICSELKREQDHRNIEFDIKTLPAAMADNSAIKQVWLNLISNAIKYSRLKENAIIEIGCHHNIEDLIYYVKDNGAGFDMRYADKLFSMFQRLHSEEEFEGTGVGLAIVQRIILKHGGKVWAEGKVNEGAIFYFSLNNHLKI